MCIMLCMRQVLLTLSTSETPCHRPSLDSRDNGSIIPESPLYGLASGRMSRTVSLPPRERSLLHSVSAYLMKQTYIAMLIVMMVTTAAPYYCKKVDHALLECRWGAHLPFRGR